ncbi:Kynurenine/alpha-aminoadipate aminotransferase, mitochondrial, partial [Armadillidium nasatum]
MNYSRFLNQLSKGRKPSIIRELTGLLTSASPELVFLAGGLPNTDLFPFEEASIQLRDGSEIKLNKKLMSQGLQYGPTPGYAPLIMQLKNMVKNLHNPPLWENSDLVILPGSQDGLCKTFEMLLEPNDYVVTQEPCYTGTLAIVGPYTPKVLAVECDDKGMIPNSLKNCLSSWDPQDIREKSEGVPKVLYLNPNACNPTGVSIPNERRKEIYKLACDYNLLILEDDPYYFIQFDDRKNFPTSFLEMDTEGRVIRFDSFSKVLSSGIRLGFATGPKPLMKQLVLHMQASILHTPSLTQIMVSELLDNWKEEGFYEHTEKVKKFYEGRRNVMLKAAEKHLSGLCEWSVPTGGMFLWIKVPELKDTWDMIMVRGLKKNVILVPGKAFSTNLDEPSNYMRASFSLATPEKMELV